ncbi:MAG: DUF983 domain-containing protein [Acetobacteraceae bacterium]|nr:DUF983 domain-containing protein [Acetobacteraceae bacterium]
MPTERWQPDRSEPTDPWPRATFATAIGRGLRGLCPACGKGKVFKGFLTVVAACEACGAPLGLARADDAPPYFTILVVGHIVVPLIFLVERGHQPPLWLMSAIFLPLTLGLAIGLLRPVKGGTVGMMLSLNMLKSDPSAT